MTFTVPIFRTASWSRFSSCMAHWPDIGGTLDGIDDRHLFRRVADADRQVLRRGVLNQEIIDIIRMNVRLPERAMGDLRAQIAAVKTGEKRFLEMIDEIWPRRRPRRHRRDHGPERGARAHASATSRTASTRPNRSWTTTASRSARVSRSRCKVDGGRRRMTVDLTDVSRQVAGFFNSGETAGGRCCQVASNA